METPPTNVLAHVRALMPPRPLTAGEERVIIERQATRLLTLTGLAGPPVPVLEVVRAIGHVRVSYLPGLDASGRTQWNGAYWDVEIAADEAHVRQRFTLAHEVFHILVHDLSDVSLPAYGDLMADRRLEHACDSFAAALLMPRLWFQRAFFDRNIQAVPDLARLFGVSYEAVRIRLTSLGIHPAYERDRERCPA